MPLIFLYKQYITTQSDSIDNLPLTRMHDCNFCYNCFNVHDIYLYPSTVNVSLNMVFFRYLKFLTSIFLSILQKIVPNWYLILDEINITITAKKLNKMHSQLN